MKWGEEKCEKKFSRAKSFENFMADVNDLEKVLILKTSTGCDKRKSSPFSKFKIQKYFMKSFDLTSSLN